MQYLKADTNVEILLGPAVAVGDGFVPVTNLTLSGADEAEIIKNNGATALVVTSISANTMVAITGADGYYTLDITTGNVDTEGPLTILVNDDSLILPIRQDYMVVNANVYDSLFAVAATDVLDVNVTEVAAASQTAGDLADLVVTVDVEVDKIVVATITNAVGTDISADILEIEAQTRKVKKNEAFSDLTFLMVDSTTKDPKTGLTVVEEVSKDGAAFAAAAGSFAEIANGIYQFDATSADMNADILIFRFSATGADDTFITIVTKP